MNFKVFPFALCLMLASKLSLAENSLCMSIKPSIDVLYDELSFEKGAVCVYKLQGDDEKVEVAFLISVDGEHKEIVNRTFFKVADVESAAPVLTLANEGNFQIVQEFPRNALAVTLKLTGSTIKLERIQQSIKLESAEFDTPHVLDISMKKTELELLNFEGLSQEQAYRAGAFELSQSSIESYVEVTSERADLLKNYKEHHNSRSYLVKGDKIKILKFEENFFFVEYAKKNGSTVKGWIKISDTL